MEALNTPNTKEAMEVVDFVNEVTEYVKKVMEDRVWDKAEKLQSVFLLASLYKAADGITKIPDDFEKLTGEEKDALLKAIFAAIKNAASAVVK